MTAEVLLEVKKMARKFVEDNYVAPTAMDYLLIDTAMLKAVIYAMDKELQDLRAQNAANASTV